MLPRVGMIQDQYTGEYTRYDPDALCPALAHGVLDYFGNTPRMPEGHNKWLIVVASRQTGKSATIALATYIKTAYNPGSTGSIIADTKNRADELFRHAKNQHSAMPADIRMPEHQSSSGATRKIVFESPGAGELGQFQTYSAQSDNIGIGRSWDFTTISEVPFIPGFGSVWSGMQPAFVNRRNALVVLESTPAPLSEPSAEIFRDMAVGAKQNPDGRFDYLFVPFFLSWANEREWRKGWVPEKHELDMLDKYGPKNGEDPYAARAPYLTFRNLAFLRGVRESDARIRREPELLWVWYPPDDVICWTYGGGGQFGDHVVAGQMMHTRYEWRDDDTYVEYHPPRADAVYAIGVDPAGWGTGDPSSFQVLEVWDDKWVHVAEFESRTADPNTVAAKICEVAKRYNDAFVTVESNGVGAGVIAILELASGPDGVVIRTPDKPEEPQKHFLKHLMYRENGKPGFAASKQRWGQLIAITIDALQTNKLVVEGDQIFSQLRSYRRDAEFDDSEQRKLMDVPSKKRKKHHWDRVSALMWACFGATMCPVRFRPETSYREAAAAMGVTLDEVAKQSEAGFRQVTYRDLKKQAWKDKSRKRKEAKSRYRR